MISYQLKVKGVRPKKSSVKSIFSALATVSNTAGLAVGLVKPSISVFISPITFILSAIADKFEQLKNKEEISKLRADIKKESNTRKTYVSFTNNFSDNESKEEQQLLPGQQAFNQKIMPETWSENIQTLNQAIIENTQDQTQGIDTGVTIEKKERININEI